MTGIMLRKVDFANLVSLAIWISAGLIWAFFITTLQFAPTDTWLLDWHVYAAGARDFLDGSLYATPLESVYRLPVSEFNYPPLSAIAVIPLLLLPDSVGGTVWVVFNVVAVAGAAILMARILGAHKPALWGGVGFLAYSIHPWMKLAFLGNNTPLVLFLVTAFAHQHLRSRERSAGALLGIAIALKLWPIALIPLLLRERRWQSVISALGVIGLVGLLTLAWLGPEIMGPAVRAMQVKAVIEPDNPVFLISWMRETQRWWPWWGAYVVAAILAAIPAKGHLGLGLGILAGLALVPNLWRTYIPTILVGAIFVIRAIYESRLSKRDEAKRISATRRTTQPAEPDSLH
jgi:Glycosyltransferase family 87